MNKLLATASIVLFSTSAALAAPHTYQVTGPVLEVTDKALIVSKGKENWEIQRDSNSKVPADVKVGSKVTVEYTMTAVEVTDKTAKKAEKTAEKPAKAEDKAATKVEDKAAAKVEDKAATKAEKADAKKK